MSKHTPGPWRSEWTNDVGPDDDYYVEFFEILNSEHKRIGTAEEKTDGRLMAAAPDLLEALKLIADVGDRAATEIARTTIAKAERK